VAQTFSPGIAMPGFLTMVWYSAWTLRSAARYRPQRFGRGLRISAKVLDRQRTLRGRPVWCDGDFLSLQLFSFFARSHIRTITP